MISDKSFLTTSRRSVVLSWAFPAPDEGVLAAAEVDEGALTSVKEEKLASLLYKSIRTWKTFSESQITRRILPRAIHCGLSHKPFTGELTVGIHTSCVNLLLDTSIGLIIWSSSIGACVSCKAVASFLGDNNFGGFGESVFG
jgi:hypothetical protein